MRKGKRLRKLGRAVTAMMEALGRGFFPWFRSVGRKPREGELVRCHVCGAGEGVTLCNDGVGRKICVRCREKRRRGRRDKGSPKN